MSIVLDYTIWVMMIGTAVLGCVSGALGSFAVLNLPCGLTRDWNCVYADPIQVVRNLTIRCICCRPHWQYFGHADCQKYLN